MVRLIDADALAYHIADEWKQNVYTDAEMVDIQLLLRHAPTVEAVPVVRCRECKYYEVGQNKVDAWSACYAHVGRIIETWDDNFCGWAERKEE